MHHRGEEGSRGEVEKILARNFRTGLNKTATNSKRL